MVRRRRLATVMAVAGLASGCTAYGWGSNANGNLGDGSRTNRNSPVQVFSTAGWNTVAAGNGHSCGVRSGTLWCWGGHRPELGLGAVTGYYTVPVQVGTATDWSTVTAGFSFSCGVRSGVFICGAGTTTGSSGSETP